MFSILLLTLLGILFVVAELLLLPGISIAGILALVCEGSAIYLAFRDFDTWVAVGITVVILLLTLLAVLILLRRKTWQRFSLQQQLHQSSADEPSRTLRPGDRGTTVSRLAPMGKISVGGTLYEAKSEDRYIDPRCEVEVTGFENFSVIVRPVDNN